jgi:hypothetical protein
VNSGPAASDIHGSIDEASTTSSSIDLDSYSISAPERTFRDDSEGIWRTFGA